MRLALALPITIAGVLAFSSYLHAQSCPTCPSNPQLACPPNTDLVCSSSGTWQCSDGSSGCAVPPPAYECPAGAQQQCTASGWRCSDGSAGCYYPPPEWLDSCLYGDYCAASGWECTPESPIIIDTKGEGFHLTDVAHGVKFAMVPGKPAAQVAWTDPNYRNGFLALDRNGDGKINDGGELFGNMTAQPPSNTPNGFLALAVYDRPANGGNGNGFIDAGDAIYDKLRVWVDSNHNGISEPGELHTLKELGIARIDLSYKTSGYVDEFGNVFRYGARIWDAAGQEHATCYDVFLQVGPAE
jgi:hypothetical protein